MNEVFRVCVHLRVPISKFHGYSLVHTSTEFGFLLGVATHITFSKDCRHTALTRLYSLGLSSIARVTHDFTFGSWVVACCLVAFRIRSLRFWDLELEGGGVLRVGRASTVMASPQPQLGHSSVIVV